jgi:hypothetical protein
MSDVQTPTPTKEKTRQMSFSVLDDGTVRAEFGEGIDPLTFHPAAMPESLFPAALAAGFIGRLRGYTSRLAGENRTPAALRVAIEKGIADLRAGTWVTEREPGEGGGEISMEAEAAYRYRVKRAEAKGEKYEGTLTEAAADFAKLTAEQKKTLKALPRYQLAWAEIKAAHNAKRAEKLAKKVKDEEDEVAF